MYKPSEYTKVICIKDHNHQIQKGKYYILEKVNSNAKPSCYYQVHKMTSIEGLLGQILGRITPKEAEEYFMDELKYKLNILLNV